MQLTEITNETLKGTLPKRRRNSHKGDYGKALLVCGSVGYSGAAFFAAEAAVRSGAGLVFMGVPSDIYTISAVKCNEAMPFPLPSDELGRLSKNASGEILERLRSCDACLIGPGLGRSEGVSYIVSQVIKNCRMPLIIDADGINAVSENINILDEAACPIIMTPHEGEFSRLGGSVLKGREQGASHFAREHKCTLILKGSGTVIAFEDGSILRNMTGNPGMAKGGSGDVLAGILTALIGQGISIRDACAAAVWLHGRAGDISKAELGEYSMTPTDLINTLPKAFRELSAD